MCVLDNARCLPETYDVVESWVVHSLCELQEGRFFTVDPWGEEWKRGLSGPICGPYRCILVGLKGDEKYMQRCLKVKASWVSGADRMCLYCQASGSGRLLYTHHGPKALHRRTLVDNISFMENGCAPNPWIRLPGFDVQRVLLDWLHVVDLALSPEASASDSWAKP